MNKSLQAFCDKEIELDSYLPGTPHETTKLYDLFPYHIWGKGTNLAAINEANERKSEIRRRELVRRRDKPSCFEEACAYGNLQAVMLMWGQEGVNIPTRKAIYEGSDASGLMWAAYRGHLDVVRFLVDRGAPIDYESSRGHTPLKWAIIGGNLDVIRFLLDNGADPSHRDKQGHDAAFTAVQRSNLAALMMLSEDALAAHALVARSPGQLNVTDGAPGAQALMHVANPNLTHPLTGKPYFILDVRRRDVAGQTLLHWAAYTNRRAVVEYLIMYWGCSVNVVDKYGRTALIWAAREGFSEVVEYLLMVGADASIQDADKLTAQKYAIMRNHPEASTVLRTFRPPRGMPTLRRDEDWHEMSAAAAESPKDAMERENGPSSPHLALLATAAPRRRAFPLNVIFNLRSTVSKFMGREYRTVRERRAAMTPTLLLTDPVFAGLAALSAVYVLLTIIFTRSLPPFLATMPFAAYFFKNMVVTLSVGHPEQGSVDTPKSIVTDMGLAMSFGQSVRGTWRTRARDPACLVAVLLFVFFQAYSWSKMGNVAFLFSTPNRRGSPITQYSREFITAETLMQLRDPSSYVGGSVMRMFGYVNAESAISPALYSLLFITLGSAAACMLCSRFSVIPRDKEGRLEQSPMWRILRTRCYRWLHPRLYLAERHMQIPVRAFYCPEIDAVVRRYDGFSVLLDCPIGEWNHVFFVIFITAFLLYECLIVSWGYTQSRLRMRAPVAGFEFYTCSHAPVYANAFLPLQSTEGLMSALHNRTMVHGFVNITSETQAQAIEASLYVPRSVMSFGWVNDILRVFIHGLPCPNVGYQYTLLESYLNGPKTWLHYGLFLFFYYIWPSKVQLHGVWVLQYGVIAIGMLAVLAYRQYRAIVFRAATCVELANPLAPGNTGDLVLIFPPKVREATVMAPYDVDEEFFYELTDPTKMRTEEDLKKGRQCIYGSSWMLMNALRFFTFTQGRSWRGAFSVTARNQPDKSPMLSS